MKVWKATLTLSNNNDYDTYLCDFKFKLEDHEYDVNRYNSNEWVYYDDWLSYKIPKEMKIEHCYKVIKVVQGFDCKLEETEIRQVEANMKNLLKEKLLSDRENILKQFNAKIQAIQ